MTATHTIAIASMATALLAGCGAPTFSVDLATPEPAAQLVDVQDARLDREVRIQAVTHTGAVLEYTIVPEPPVATALARLVTARAPALHVAPPRITLERLDIRSHIGFGQPDEQLCEAQSSVASDATAAPTQVRTVARDNSNLNPRVQSMARAILSTCLAQHASDIARVIPSRR